MTNINVNINITVMEYLLCVSLCAKHSQIDIISTLLMKTTEARSDENFTQSPTASKRWIWDWTLGLPDFIEANDNSSTIIIAANTYGTFPLCVAFC